MFLQFLIISLLSLLITFVLFRYLNAWAEGQTKILGGTVRYGGALAGFALCFLLLFGAYAKMLEQQTTKTDVDIHGAWTLRLTPGDESEVRTGKATITQDAGSERFVIVGHLDFSELRSALTFKSLAGVIHNRHLVFVYETTSQEGQQLGIAVGDLPENTPDKFEFYYYDATKRDLDKDTAGRVELVRLP